MTEIEIAKEFLLQTFFVAKNGKSFCCEPYWQNGVPP
jgi:hypothetical protein